MIYNQLYPAVIGSVYRQKQKTQGTKAAESSGELVANAVADSGWAGRQFLKLTGALKLTTKRIPLIGAAVTSLFVAKEAFGYLMRGETDQLGACLLCGAGEIAGNIVGFGIGDVAREGIRKAFVKYDKEKYASIERSDLLVVGDYLAEKAGFSDIFNMHTDKPYKSKIRPNSDMVDYAAQKPKAFGLLSFRNDFNQHKTSEYIRYTSLPCAEKSEVKTNLSGIDLFQANKKTALSSENTEPLLKTVPRKTVEQKLT